MTVNPDAMTVRVKEITPPPDAMTVRPDAMAVIVEEIGVRVGAKEVRLGEIGLPLKEMMARCKEMWRVVLIGHKTGPRKNALESKK